MHDDTEDCDGCDECTTFVPIASRRWSWLDALIALFDFFAESSLAWSRAMATVNDCMRAHYNWRVDRRVEVEMSRHDSISLTGE